MRLKNKFFFKIAAVFSLYGFMGLNLVLPNVFVFTRNCPARTIESNVLSPEISINTLFLQKKIALLIEMRHYLPVVENPDELIRELSMDEELVEIKAVKQMIVFLKQALEIKEEFEINEKVLGSREWRQILSALNRIDIDSLRRLLPKQYMEVLFIVISLKSDAFINTGNFELALKNFRIGFQLPGVRFGFRSVFVMAFLLSRTPELNKAVEWFEKAEGLIDSEAEKEKAKCELYPKYYTTLIMLGDTIYQQATMLKGRQRKQRMAKAAEMYVKAVSLIEEVRRLAEITRGINYREENKVTDLMGIIHSLEMQSNIDINAGRDAAEIILNINRAFAALADLSKLEIKMPKRIFIVGKLYVQYIDLKISLLLRLIREKKQDQIVELFEKINFDSFARRFQAGDYKDILARLEDEQDKAAEKILARDVYRYSKITGLALEKFSSAAGRLKLGSYEKFVHLINLYLYQGNYNAAYDWLLKSKRLINDESSLKDMFQLHCLVEPEMTKKFLIRCVNANLLTARLVKNLKNTLSPEKDKELAAVLIEIYQDNKAIRQNFDKYGLAKALDIEAVKEQPAPREDSLYKGLKNKVQSTLNALKLRKGKGAKKPASLLAWEKALDDVAAEIESADSPELIRVVQGLANDNFILNRELLVRILVNAAAAGCRQEMLGVLDVVKNKISANLALKLKKDIMAARIQLKAVLQGVESFIQESAQLRQGLDEINYEQLSYSEAMEKMKQYENDWDDILTRHEAILGLSRAGVLRENIEKEITGLKANIENRNAELSVQAEARWIRMVNTMEESFDTIINQGLSKVRLLGALNDWVRDLDFPEPDDDLKFTKQGIVAQKRAIRIFDKKEAQLKKLEMICHGIVRLVIYEDFEKAVFRVEEIVPRKFLRRFEFKVKKILRELLEINPDIEILFSGDQDNAEKVKSGLEVWYDDVFDEMEMIEAELDSRPKAVYSEEQILISI